MELFKNVCTHCAGAPATAQRNHKHWKRLAFKYAGNHKCINQNSAYAASSTQMAPLMHKWPPVCTALGDGATGIKNRANMP